MRISSGKGSEIFVFMPRISFGTFLFFFLVREIEKNLADCSGFAKNSTISILTSSKKKI